MQLPTDGALDAPGAPMQNPIPSEAPRVVIVVAVDGTADSDRVVDAACDYAKRVPGSEIHLVHAVEPRTTVGAAAAEAHDRERARARLYLDEKAKAAQSSSGVTVVGHFHEAAPAAAILQTAASVDADLVMVGTHDRKGVAHWVFGSVAERVTREASCPVLVVRPKHHDSRKAPEIEPPCPDCLDVQRDSKSAKLWCERHSEHHPVAHLHYEMPQGFGEGSSLLRP